MTSNPTNVRRSDRGRLLPRWAAAIAMWACLPLAIGWATPGNLDPGFGVGGLALTDLPGSYSEIPYGLTVQPDGKIIVTGQDGSGFGLLTVLRYLPDGHLDPTFGVDGIFVMPDTNAVQIGKKVVVLSDGKLMVLANGLTLVRLMSDGTLDATFGTDGVVRATIPGVFAGFVDMERQADDKLVLFGTTSQLGSEFALARFDADGNLDPTFGTGGITTTPLASASSADARFLTQQADGKLVAGGNQLMRYSSEGIPDPSFGVGGTVAGASFALDAVADPDGKLVTAGFRLRRLEADGTPDLTFGVDGVAEVDLDRLDADISFLNLTAVVRQSDGKYVGGGSIGRSGLLRFTAEGKLDTTFGLGGVVALPTTVPFLTGLVQQPDEKLVAVGGYGSYAVARVLADVCGDGVQQDGEACEDGDLVDGDGCDANCTVTACGNGVVTAGEQCDDGNLAAGDCCAPKCQLEADASPCDDGNACTTSDTCVQGVCVAGTETDCADADACTTDACEPASGLCRHEYQPTDTCTAPFGNLAWISLLWAKGSTGAYSEPHFGNQLLLAGDQLFATAHGSETGGEVEVLDRETGALRHVVTTSGPERSSSDIELIAALGDDLLVTIVPDEGGPSVAARYDGTTFDLVRTFDDPTPETEWSRWNGTLLLGIGDKLVVDDGEEHVVYVFDAATGALVHTLQPAPPEDPLEFGRRAVPLGTKLLVSGAGVVHLFDLATGMLVRSFVDPTPDAGAFGDAIATIGGDVLIGGRREDAVYRFDGATGALLRTFADPDHADRTFGQSIVVAADDVVIGRAAGRVHVFAAATGAFRHTILDPSPTDGNCFGRTIAVFDGNLAISDFCADPVHHDGEQAGLIYLFDSTGALIGMIPNPSPDYRDALHAVLAFDRTILAVTFEDGEGRVYAFRSCVDGAIVSGEECDDGNLVSGDGCDNNCTATVCGNGIVTSGEECDDGNEVDGDACRNDCTANPCGWDCGPCYVCGSEARCVPAPDSGCRQSLSPHDGTLMMQSAAGGRPQLSWRWRKGAATPPPSPATSYTLCVFDESDTAPRLVLQATAPAGGFCPDGTQRPCWKQSARGALSYRNREGAPHGITALTIVPGTDGHAQVTLNAAGDDLELPSLPLAVPIRVQLQSYGGQCWEETYSTPGRNDAARFRSRGD